MIDTFRNSSPGAYQKVVGKIELRQEPVPVSDTRKVDLSNHVFLDSPFCGPMLKRLATLKINNAMCPKNVTCKNFELSK